jgi:hypothetical protein
VFSVVQFSSTVWYFYEIHGVKKVNAGALTSSASHLDAADIFKKKPQSAQSTRSGTAAKKPKKTPRARRIQDFFVDFAYTL